jgi:hypothetical protein
MVGGASLCGEVTELVGCPVCLSRLLALLLVHIQSARKPDKSFCGKRLTGEGISPMGTSGADVAPVYVSIERAREMLGERSGGLAVVLPPICSGCEVNLERFDEAHRRHSRAPNGERETRGIPSGRVAGRVDDED